MTIKVNMIVAIKKPLIALATQIPVAGVGYAWSAGELAVGPARAAAAVMAYEVALLAGSVLVNAWPERERELAKALATWLHAAFLNLFSRFRRDYLRHILWSHRTFNVRGLRTQGAYAIELDQVFVDLRIAPSGVRQASADPVAPRELPDSGPIWDFLRPILKHDANALSIIGPPGSGKTTLLQHIALIFAANRQRRYRMPALVPIFLFLRDHIETVTKDDAPPLGAVAETHIRQSGGLSPPPGWFEHLLRNGGAIVLLDGLDEVAKKEQRVLVSRWVEKQISSYPRCPFVLTARPGGYKSAPLRRAQVLEVVPFGPEQVRRFVHNWYLATEIVKRGGKADGGVRKDAEKRAQDLLVKLRGHSAFGELTRNPLLLTMIAMVHNYRGALPGRRVELYAEISDVLLGHWEEGKGLAIPLTPAQIRAVLQPLAAHMMELNARDIRASQALSVMKPALAKIGVDERTAKTFLADVQARSGLLLEREQGRWAFAHLTFQEYLASAHFLEKSWPADLSTVVESTWWQETVRLYSAQADATPVLQACLRSGSVQALALAADCIDEAKQVDPDIRWQVNDLLEKGLTSEDPQRFRIAAEVRLERRLRSLHRIDNERSIDLSYLTAAEYQLFLDDLPREVKAGQPKEPILGITATDALSFSDWLARRKGAAYRLPTPQEVADSPPRQANLGTWCSNGGLADIDSKDASRFLARLRARGSQAIPIPDELPNHRALARARNRATEGDLALDLAFDLARTVAPTPAHNLGVNGGHPIVRTRHLVADRTRNLAVYHARSFAFTLEQPRGSVLPGSVTNAIDAGHFKRAATSLSQTPEPDSESEKRIRTLLRDLLALLNATTPLDRGRASAQYAAHVLEYVWIGMGQMAGFDTAAYHDFRLLAEAGKFRPVTENERREIAKVYWYLHLLDAQLAGEIPPLGGIRLVRETPPLDNPVQ